MLRDGILTTITKCKDLSLKLIWVNSKGKNQFLRKITAFRRNSRLKDMTEPSRHLTKAIKSTRLSIALNQRSDKQPMATSPRIPTKNPHSSLKTIPTQSPQTNDKNMNIIFSDMIYISLIIYQ